MQACLHAVYILWYFVLNEILGSIMQRFSRKDFTILLGNAVDHFDTSIYAFLAPVMAPLFFPHADPVVGLIMAYSIFATSIITRPFGTYIFGMICKSKWPK
jgi:divalent metal cation (Fe/Co/Zn/Cd) transporter